MKILFLIPLIFITTACGKGFSAIAHNFAAKGSSQPLPPPAYEEFEEADLFKMSYRWDGKHVESDEWTLITSRAIDDFELLSIPTPKDITDFCPRYNELSHFQRRGFWIYLLSSMVQLESSFNPQTSYQENFKDNTGAFVISRGLLQLSIESSKGYKCPISTAQELHDPEINLNCGMRILTYFLKKDGVITAKDSTKWLGGARYWAVLRSSAPTIKGWTQNIDICKR